MIKFTTNPWLGPNKDLDIFYNYPFKPRKAVIVRHYHHCPSCYTIHSCTMECTIEPDLEDPVAHPGKKFGSHCECEHCLYAGKFDKEFWDRYNGFIK